MTRHLRHKRPSPGRFFVVTNFDKHLRNVPQVSDMRTDRSTRIFHTSLLLRWMNGSAC